MYKSGNGRAKGTVLFLAMLGIISGCASTGYGTSPEYDYQQNALIAPGYPVERINDPDGATLLNTSAEKAREDYEDGADGSARTETLVASWINETENIVGVVYYRGILGGYATGEYWLDWDESDGTEMIDGKTFEYAMLSGNYRDVVNLDNASNLPDCGVATILRTVSPRRDRLTGFEYTEEVPCGALARFSNSDEKALRERAYRFFHITP
jgi:hypothetical protein